MGSVASRRSLGGGVAAFAAGAAGWALGACGTGGRDAPAAPAASLAPAQIEFLGRAPGVYEQTFVDLNRTFGQRHPHLTVSYAHEAGNFDEKYQTLIAAGQQPDVFFSSNAGFKYYVARGVTVFLDDLARKDRDFRESDYEPYWMELVKYKKRLAALPYDPGAFVNYVNKNHFQKAGLRSWDTRSPVTWEEVLEACRRLVAGSGGDTTQWAIEADFGRAWWQIPRQWGVLDVYEGDDHKLKLDDPQALQALQWLADLRARHRVAKPAGAAGTPFTFQAGNLSIQTQGVQVVGFGTYRALEDDWDWVPLPTFQGKKRVGMALASPTIMGATTRSKDASWALMKFLAGPDAQAIALERGISQPMLKAHRNHPAFARNKPPSTPDVPLNETQYAVPPPMGPTYLEVNAVMSRVMDPVYRGEQTAAQAIQAAQPEFKKILEDARQRFPV
jgi:ABC-type glycerol-3-phosphate transport system substrate-binding protein